MDRIIFSVEGYTKEIYEKYRVGSDFKRVYENISALSRLKKEKQVQTPKIRIQSVCIPEIEETKETYMNFWAGFADEITIIDYRDESDEFNSLNSDGWECPYLWLRLTIAYDGSVYPCCFVTKNQEKYECEANIGNISVDSIESIWNSKKLNAYRLQHMKGLSQNISICSKCSYRGTDIMKNTRRKLCLD